MKLTKKQAEGPVPVFGSGWNLPQQSTNSQESGDRMFFIGTWKTSGQRPPCEAIVLLFPFHTQTSPESLGTGGARVRW